MVLAMTDRARRRPSQRVRQRRAIAIAAVSALTLGMYTFTRAGSQPGTQSGSGAQHAGSKQQPSQHNATSSGKPQLLITTSGVTVLVQSKQHSGWRVITPCGLSTTIATGTPISNITVMIDPGHGGRETGADEHGIRESILNLDVAKVLQHDLERLGIHAALTRTADYRLPIATRADFVNAVHPKLFISLHHNSGAAAARTSPGTEVYYQHTSTSAKRLAGLVWQDLVHTLETYAADWVGASDAGAIYRLNPSGSDFFGVLRRTQGIPAVLVEPTYISSGSEATLLKTSSFRAAEASAIAHAVQRFLTTNDQGAGFHEPLSRGNSDPGGGGGEAHCNDPSLG